MKTSAYECAPFWRRALAYIADGLILYVGQYLISFVVGFLMAFAYATVTQRNIMEDQPIFFLVVMFLLGVATYWLYFAAWESSDFSATPGKLIFQIEVRDTADHQLTFDEASIRHFCRILSFISVFGVLMPLWSHRNQALHDIMCKTVCVYKRF
ncbi:RDD family protein [Agrobacterium salinitolerans]|nr:RDD family protein [Agrobacterium salinitolerans]